MGLQPRHVDGQPPGGRDAEMFRIDVMSTWRRLRTGTDFLFCATNPDVPRRPRARGTTVGGVDLIAEHGLDAALGNNAALTIPANLSGNPAITIPAGLIDGCP